MTIIAIPARTRRRIRFSTLRLTENSTITSNSDERVDGVAHEGARVWPADESAIGLRLREALEPRARA
jgi:hypothetical protein